MVKTTMVMLLGLSASLTIPGSPATLPKNLRLTFTPHWSSGYARQWVNGKLVQDDNMDNWWKKERKITLNSAWASGKPDAWTWRHSSASGAWRKVFKTIQYAQPPITGHTTTVETYTLWKANGIAFLDMHQKTTGTTTLSGQKHKVDTDRHVLYEAHNALAPLTPPAVPTK